MRENAHSRKETVIDDEDICDIISKASDKEELTGEHLHDNIVNDENDNLNKIDSEAYKQLSNTNDKMEVEEVEVEQEEDDYDDYDDGFSEEYLR